MTKISKRTKEKRERLRAIVERDRQRVLRQKQISDFAARLQNLFQRNEAMKQDLHDEADYPQIDDRDAKAAWELYRPNPELQRRKYAAARAVDDLEKYLLEQYKAMAVKMKAIEDDDEKDCERVNEEWSEMPQCKGLDERRALEEKEELNAMDRRQAVIDGLLRGDKLD